MKNVMNTDQKPKKYPVVFWIFASALCIWMALVTAPLIVRLLVEFPSLAQTEHLKGTISSRVIRRMGRNGPGRMADIHIDTGSEKVRLDCGYFLHPRPCQDFHLIDGSRGEVWRHPLFGVVQWRLIHPDTGRAFFISADVRRDFYENYFPWTKYLGELVLPMFLMIVCVFTLRR